MKKIIISIILVVILVAGGVAVGIIKTRQNETPSSTVEMDLNPSAVFTVNSNNVVLSVAYTNEDADLIYSDIKIIGRKIEDVAKDFAQNAIEASSLENQYINISADASTDGSTNCINITISGNQKQAENLRSAIENKINTVFDENGIFGRASTQIVTQTTDLVGKYESIATKLNIDLTEFNDKTEAEVLKIINEQTKRYQGLISTQFSEVEAYINGSVIQPLQDTVDQLQASIAEHKANIQQWEDAHSEFIPDLIKNQIKQAKNEISRLESQVKSKMAEINQKIDAYVKTLREEAKTTIAELKTELVNRIEANKTALQNHKANFEANKQAVLAEIQAWRDSFNV